MISSINNENLRFRDLDDIKCIVLHHTGSKASDEAMVRFLKKDDYISCHYMIGVDGRMYHLVDDNRIAYHAGESSWRGLKSKGNSLNWCSIGIEINSDGYYFTDEQRQSTKHLIRMLMHQYNIPPEMVLRHSDITLKDPIESRINYLLDL